MTSTSAKGEQQTPQETHSHLGFTSRLNTSPSVMPAGLRGFVNLNSSSVIGVEALRARLGDCLLSAKPRDPYIREKFTKEQSPSAMHG